MRTIPLLALCFIAVVAYSQTAYVSVQVDSNYNQWGWKAIILKNDLITFATVPAIGARAMKYDLGNLQSLYVNPSELGKTYTPAQNGQWHNFGGFKTWPAPQSSWNTGGWPPPPNLDCGNYTFQIDSLSPTYKAVSVSSPTEKWFAPNVRFERTATAYPGTSRIKMEQRIINDGTSAVSWSVWGVSQSIVNHPGKTDYQNYWVYFPINPNSHYGTSGVSPQGPSTAWKGEIAPGIYGVQFSTDNQKIYADPDRGWIVYADISDSVIFAKTFDVFEGAQYPDNGARVSVYVSGSVAPIYLEAEVKGPMVQLDANGGSYNFTENWWAAKVRGPNLSVDSVGAVAGKLAFNSSTKNLSGIYGVFYQGTAKVVFAGAEGEILAEGESHAVSPLAEFQLTDSVSIPNGAVTAEVRVYDESSSFVGVLDSASVSQLISTAVQNTPARPSGYYLAPNYPNPFNSGTVLTFSSPGAMRGSLKIYDVLGRVATTLVEGELGAGEHRYVWNPERIASGVYIARLEAPGVYQMQKLVYLR